MPNEDEEKDLKFNTNALVPANQNSTIPENAKKQQMHEDAQSLETELQSLSWDDLDSRFEKVMAAQRIEEQIILERFEKLAAVRNLFFPRIFTSAGENIFVWLD